MNLHPGVIGRKLGMTQIFTEDGSVIPCTVIEARPIVVAKRTKEKDGYDALVLGIDDRKEKHTNKPLAGGYKKSGVPAKRVVRRHHFAGNVQTHGTHEYRRHGGSIGQRKTPGRTFPGMRMAGQHGNWTVSVLNQKIVKLVPDQNLVLISG